MAFIALIRGIPLIVFPEGLRMLRSIDVMNISPLSFPEKPVES